MRRKIYWVDFPKYDDPYNGWVNVGTFGTLAEAKQFLADCGIIGRHATYFITRGEL